jgi:glutathione S-transferase
MEKPFPGGAFHDETLLVAAHAFTTLWLMEETGVPYEQVLIDIHKGSQRTLEFLAVNPMGKVPALADGDATLAKPPRSATSPNAIRRPSLHLTLATRIAPSISTGCSSRPVASSLRSRRSPPKWN